MAGDDTDRTAGSCDAENIGDPDYSSGSADLIVCRIYEKEKMDQVRGYEIRFVRATIEIFEKFSRWIS